jgi:hypothetical protein
MKFTDRHVGEEASWRQGAPGHVSSPAAHAAELRHGTRVGVRRVDLHMGTWGYDRSLKSGVRGPATERSVATHLTAISICRRDLWPCQHRQNFRTIDPGSPARGAAVATNATAPGIRDRQRFEVATARSIGLLAAVVTPAIDRTRRANCAGMPVAGRNVAIGLGWKRRVRLAEAVVTPAHESVVRANTTGMRAPPGDLAEGGVDGHSRNLTGTVIPPTDDTAVETHAARMVTTARDEAEGSSGRKTDRATPAFRLKTRQQPAHMAIARCEHQIFRTRRSWEASPAADLMVKIQYAAVIQTDCHAAIGARWRRPTRERCTDAGEIAIGQNATGVVSIRRDA